MRDVLGDKFDKIVVTASYEPLLPLRLYSREVGIRHPCLLDGQYRCHATNGRPPVQVGRPFLCPLPLNCPYPAVQIKSKKPPRTCGKAPANATFIQQDETFSLRIASPCMFFTGRRRPILRATRSHRAESLSPLSRSSDYGLTDQFRPSRSLDASGSVSYYRQGP